MVGCWRNLRKSADERKMKQKRKRENPMKGRSLRRKEGGWSVGRFVGELVRVERGEEGGEKSPGKRRKQARGEKRGWKKPDESHAGTLRTLDIGVFSFVIHYHPFFVQPVTLSPFSSSTFIPSD